MKQCGLTFKILRAQQDRAKMVVLDERSDLRIDGGPIKAHHKELAHLSEGEANATAAPLSAIESDSILSAHSKR